MLHQSYLDLLTPGRLRHCSLPVPLLIQRSPRLSVTLALVQFCLLSLWHPRVPGPIPCLQCPIDMSKNKNDKGIMKGSGTHFSKCSPIGQTALCATLKAKTTWSWLKIPGQTENNPTTLGDFIMMSATYLTAWVFKSTKSEGWIRKNTVMPYADISHHEDRGRALDTQWSVPVKEPRSSFAILKG